MKDIVIREIAELFTSFPLRDRDETEMPRSAFEMVPLVGFSSPGGGQLRSLAAVNAGERLFAGTQEGALAVTELRADTTAAVRAGSFECALPEVLRMGAGGSVTAKDKDKDRDKKAVASMMAISGWRALLVLVDGQLSAYDLHTFRPFLTVPESRGATCFFADEERRLVYVGNKKKVQIFSWQSVGVVPRRDVVLSDTPRSLTCAPLAGGGCSGLLVVALSRDYVIVDSELGSVTPLDAISTASSASPPGAHAVTLPVPACPARAARVLISAGSKGVLVDVIEKGQQERLSWTASPVDVRISAAFFVAALPSRIEVHDMARLTPIQSFDLPSAAPASCLAVCEDVGGGRGAFCYAGTLQGVHLLKMIPMSFQVEALLESKSYEEALTLCSMCEWISSSRSTGQEESPALLQGLRVESVHERYAHELFSWGDYEGATEHFLKADMHVEDVVRMFHGLIPPDYSLPGVAPPAPALEPGAPLSRAAAALAKFLEKKRPALAEEALREECEGEGNGGDGKGPLGLKAEVLDTVLVHVYLKCTPPRRQAIIEMLSSGHCWCQLQATAPLLAGGGLAMMEPLLWLYRSRGEHARALALLKESTCVAKGGAAGWTLEEFRLWSVAYLRSLWFSSDPSHPPLVPPAARQILESAPSLGLTIFTGEPKGRGRARRQPLESSVSIPDVVSFLKSIQPLAPAEGGPAGALATADSWSSELQLTSGRALAIAYLEHLTAAEPHRTRPLSDAAVAASSFSRDAPSSTTTAAMIHDELAYLLMEGVLAEQGGGGDSLEAAYRYKLRQFLKTSQHYNPARLLAIVPSNFLHEHALLLSRLHRHQEVLQIYVCQLKDQSLAEEYCDRIWRERLEEGRSSSSLGGKQGEESESEDVYICLLRVLIDMEERGLTSPVLNLLGKYFDRVDPVKAMALLPADLPLVKLGPFLTSVLRHHESKRRMAQMTHHLSRAEYVNAKYELTQLQSQVSRVPEVGINFAHLGRLQRSSPQEEVLEAGGGNEYQVTCTQHQFEAHLVLQFHIINPSPDSRLVNVSVRCEPIDPDVLTVSDERTVDHISPLGRGSCYAVLEKGTSGASSVSACIACDLRVNIVATDPATGAAQGPPGGYYEEIQLQDVEIL